MDSKEKEHLLVLKVMRLTKPTLAPSQPLICDTRDLPGTAFAELTLSDLPTDKQLPSFGVGQLLTLPQNFGNIFLGETFSSYISVHNDSDLVCTDINIKADLQTSSQRLSLSTNHSEPVAILEPEKSIDDIIHHEVKELGTHILVCAVSYTTNIGEQKYFRKFFKFQVLKPLEVKTKFYNAENDDVFLEAQIQNVTPGPVVMETVALEPSEQYTCRDLTFSVDDKSMDFSVFGRVNYMNPLDTRQYLYCLTPSGESGESNRLLKGVTNIGKLDIVWKTNLGEKGRLQTSQLQRVAPGYGDIRLTVDTLPEIVQVEKPFEFTCKVTNCCERTMDLTMTLENEVTSRGLFWCGISGRQLGKLSPGEHLKLHLSMIAVQPGLQTISGLRLTDSFLKRTYEYDEVTQVFIYSGEMV